MNKRLTIILLIFGTLLLFSEDGVIELKNSNVEDRENIVDENQQGSVEDSRDFLNRGQGYKVYPKSLYIGDLTPLENLNSGVVLKKAKAFCHSIVNKGSVVGLSKEYAFIFEEVYRDLLLSEDIDIISWNLSLEDGDNVDSISVEFHLESSVVIGDIYFDNSDIYEITDVQLDKKEKILFDSSSPILLF